jgi:hypothetical protein
MSVCKRCGAKRLTERPCSVCNWHEPFTTPDVSPVPPTGNEDETCKCGHGRADHWHCHMNCMSASTGLAAHE